MTIAKCAVTKPVRVDGKEDEFRMDPVIQIHTTQRKKLSPTKKISISAYMNLVPKQV